jgi:threonine/homoserine/homoserine lactone efflux protein
MHAKALLFFLVFLPQFVVPGKVPVEQQLFMLGCTLTVISTTFHTLLAAIASSTSTFLARHAESRSSALLGSPDGHPNSPTCGHLNSPTLATAR